MAIKFTSRKCGADYYFVDFFKRYISEYNLAGMSNNIIPNIPNIDLSNPLALMYQSVLNSDGTEVDTTILPAIGISFLDEKESEKNTLGNTEQTTIITRNFINQIKLISLEDRFSIGIFLSDDSITEIESILDTKESESLPLYAIKLLRQTDISLNVSMWATSKQHIRLMTDVVRSLIKISFKDLSNRGIKDVKFSVTGDLYNYDFSETLYGSEIKIDYKDQVSDWNIDEQIGQIKQIELTGIFQTQETSDSLTRTITTERLS